MPGGLSTVEYSTSIMTVNISNPIDAARRKLMSNRKVICTGNPDREGTLAQGFRKLFPDALFLCRGNGWDLTDHSDRNLDNLRQAFKGHNTFLNCSYIEPGVQEKLLDVCHDSLKFCDVVNIGSTHEFDGLGSIDYRDSKIRLRNKSLEYNSFRFSTCHFILGGIRRNDNYNKELWLEVDKICEMVTWIWQQEFRVPIMAMDSQKEPW